MDQLVNFLSENRNMVIGGLVLLVLIWLWRGKRSAGLGGVAHNWQGEMAQVFESLVRLYGEPEFLDGSVEGNAIWTQKQLKEKGSPFYQVEFGNKVTYHSKPVPHGDSLDTWIKVDGEVPKDKLPGLSKISKSISLIEYSDNDKEESVPIIRVYCRNLIYNVVGHWIAKQYLTGVLTLDEAAGKYGPMIMELTRAGVNSPQFGHLYNEI